MECDWIQHQGDDSLGGQTNLIKFRTYVDNENILGLLCPQQKKFTAFWQK